jgi:DNA-directed RNA polymerase specialized sigma24 family protein
MIIRKKRNSREVSAHAPNIGETLSDVPDIAPNPESRYAERKRGRFLRDAISNLRPAIRRVVELQVFEDHSLGETAAHIGISVSAAKSRVFHAKVALSTTQDQRDEDREDGVP